MVMMRDFDVCCIVDSKQNSCVYVLLVEFTLVINDRYNSTHTRQVDCACDNDAEIPAAPAVTINIFHQTNVVVDANLFSF